MPDIIVLMGPQGAGKGTQAQMLGERLKLPLVATGDILREIAQTDTPLGRQVHEAQSAGRLVSDDILAEVIKTRLGAADCERGCIMDGFPRTLPQARLLEAIAEELKHQIRVVSIEVPRDALFKRLTGRRTCSTCGAIYHLDFMPSREPGICDLDRGQLFTRSDDNEEAITQRLSLYDQKTRPLLDYYRESGRLIEVDGAGSPEDVSARIVRASGGEIALGTN